MRRRETRRFGGGPYLLGLARTEDWGRGFPFELSVMRDVEELRRAADA
jgi:hypothetical protein